DPEDLVQETYLRAYAAFGSYRGGNTRAWLAAICLNAARSQARRRRRRPWEVPGPALLDVLPRSRADGGGGGPGGGGRGVARLGGAPVVPGPRPVPGPAAGAGAGMHRAGGCGRVHREGGGGGAGVPARHGAGPGAPGPAKAGPVAGRGGGGPWTAMTGTTGCWRRFWPGIWTLRLRGGGMSTS